MGIEARPEAEFKKEEHVPVLEDDRGSQLSLRLLRRQKRESCCRDLVSHDHRANRVARRQLHRGPSRFPVEEKDPRLDQANRVAQR